MTDRYRSRDRDDDRNDDRGYRSRSRDDDRGSSRRRDDDDRGSRSRDRDDRDDDRRSRDRDEDRRGSSSGYTYRARSAEQTRQRSEKGANDFDKIIKDGIKVWKPNDGLNRIRILPPTWPDAEHYGHDIYVHYGVGADRGQYLCLNKMLGKPDPIEEERVIARKDGDEKYAKDLEAKRRVGIYLIDRDHERDGVQFWAMPWTLDRDIVKVSMDRSTGEVLPIDHPEEGFDVEFEKKGAKDRTEYLGVAIARRSTPLGKASWLDFAVENPIPDQLQYFDYDHIAKAFGGGGEQRDTRSARDDDRDDDRGSRSRTRTRDDDHDDDRRGGRDDDRGYRGRDRDSEPDLDWDGVHEMSGKELEDLVELKDLDLNPNRYDSDDELADAICEELGLEKPGRSRDRDDDRGSSRERGEGLGGLRNRRRVE